MTPPDERRSPSPAMASPARTPGFRSVLVATGTSWHLLAPTRAACDARPLHNQHPPVPLAPTSTATPSPSPSRDARTAHTTRKFVTIHPPGRLAPTYRATYRATGRTVGCDDVAWSRVMCQPACLPVNFEVVTRSLLNHHFHHHAAPPPRSPSSTTTTQPLPPSGPAFFPTDPTETETSAPTPSLNKTTGKETAPHRVYAWSLVVMDAT
ncbi:hypothetical protein BZA05DRAFT_392210 [Tricharina praecox]|uniref:uncharacterized protein n=1 Tax=Tricharina praecox TaxID=43433 RepID=UPI00222080B9|nr:uncharacterized protein BZA05DRAFT_392210 [Tricharina praecox]KAI5854673.1 hypothetical protein BZA05DRAFT_392210 [Tricharina praecox]